MMSIMCRLLLGLILLLPTACAVAHLSGSEGTAQPRVWIDTHQRDLGSVHLGSDVSAIFRVGNDGSRRLILTKQETCCGSAPETIIIPPRSAREVAVPAHTSRHTLGKSRESVIYETNDRQCPILEFTVFFDVKLAV